MAVGETGVRSECLAGVTLLLYQYHRLFMLFIEYEGRYAGGRLFYQCGLGDAF